MKKFLKQYYNPNTDKINIDLMNHSQGETMMFYVINCCKILEISKHIKIIGYEYVDDESKIDNSFYYSSRNKDYDDYKITFIKDSRCDELRIKFRLTTDEEEQIVEKRILIPIADRWGYYTIKGNRYILMYQLVDVTFNKGSSVVLKTTMGIDIERKSHEIKDARKNVYNVPIYNVDIFRVRPDIILLYLAKFGVDKTLRYFGVSKIVRFDTTFHDDDEVNLYFPISSSFFIVVNKHMFERHQYVKSIVGMILKVSTNRVNKEILEDSEYWYKKIGMLYTTANPITRGTSMVYSFERMFDDTTQYILKLNRDNKEDVYSVCRWMIQNFNELRAKDNQDINNKRVRDAEYRAMMLSVDFTTRIRSVIREGNNVKMKTLKDTLKFPGDIIISKLYSSGILRYDDQTNDLDFFTKFKYTTKGPNALGNKSANTIGAKSRTIHPSYIGKVDINVFGNSDPGTSGMLTPFCKTPNMYFSDKNEPENGAWDMAQDRLDVLEQEGYHVERMGLDTPEKYYGVEDKSKDVTLETYKHRFK